MSNDPPASRPESTSRFPLSTLFTITAIASACLAMIAPMARATHGAPQGTTLAIGAGTLMLAGLVAGPLIGALHSRRLRGAAWGLLLGLLCGTAAAGLWQASLAAPDSTLRLAMVGCLIALCSVFAANSARRPDPVNAKPVSVKPVMPDDGGSA